MDSIERERLQAEGVVAEMTVARFRDELHGRLLRPGDAGYDAARHVYNAMIDKYPAFIAQCADAADVSAAVNFGRDHGLPIAVRGGGHNGAGLGGRRAGH